MSSNTPSSQTDEIAVRDLYRRLLDCWNRRNAAEFAALFSEDGNMIGFDGSQYNGRNEIEAEIGRVFAEYMTTKYVGKIREIRLLTAVTALLRAVVGLVPPGGSDLNPAVNAIQTLAAAKHADKWLIEPFLNTPAQFHGRTELAQH